MALSNWGWLLFEVVVRDTKIFSENVQSGVEYLNTVRHMLQEYDPINCHTIPMKGDLLE